MHNAEVVLQFYTDAKSSVDAAGFSWERDWQQNLSFDDFTETDLLRELAWVVLCSGFKESVIRKKFDYISLCFCDWESAEAISKYAELCRATALSSFGNKKKIDALIASAHRIHEIGYGSIRDMILNDPINELQQFPYIGSITSWHLAKNLGLNVAKPDRHLIRLSDWLGFGSAHDLCEFLSHNTGEPTNVVDIVLWRYAALNARILNNKLIAYSNYSYSI